MNVLRQISKPIKSPLSILYKLLHSRYFLPVVFAAAFAIRLTWILVVNVEPVSDFKDYFDIGVNILRGKGYYMNGKPSAFRPIGYPAFLAFLFSIFGVHVFVAKMANVLLYMGILALSYLMARALYKSELVARLTVLILTFHPNHIVYSALVASETPCLFLLMAALLLLLVEKRTILVSLICGVTFGLACLARPEGLLVPAILLIPSLVMRFSIKRCIPLMVIYAALFATLLPWTIRNYKVFGHFVLVSTKGGAVLQVGNNPYASGGWIWNDYLASVKREATRQAPNEYWIDRAMRKSAVDYMRAHPFRTLQLWPAKAYYMWRYDHEGMHWNDKGLSIADKRKPSVLKARIVGWGLSDRYYWLVGGMAFLGAIVQFYRMRKGERRNYPFPFMGLSLILYYTWISMVFLGETRFHFHLIPWIAMYAALFLAEGISLGAGVPKPAEQCPETADPTTAISSDLRDSDSHPLIQKR